MGKVFFALAAVVAVAVFFLYGRHDAGARVASCLEKKGATVQRSRFFESSFGALAGADGAAQPWTKALKQVDKHVWDVTFADTTGLLIEAKSSSRARAFAEGITLYAQVTPQRGGRVVILWDGSPSETVATAGRRCLH